MRFSKLRTAKRIGYEEEVSPTLRAGVVPATLSVENHPTDGRVKIRKDDTCQTLCSRAGTGGNNVPLVAEPVTLKIRSGCEGGGKGPIWQTDKSATLGTNNDQTLFQPEIKAFGVCSKHSNAMMSDNPHSGFYEATTSRTLDQSGGNSVTSNQGDIEDSIMTQLIANPHITRKQLAAVLHLSEQPVRYRLEKLQRKGRIYHKGSTKSGEWVISGAEQP